LPDANKKLTWILRLRKTSHRRPRSTTVNFYRRQISNPFAAGAVDELPIGGEEVDEEEVAWGTDLEGVVPGKSNSWVAALGFHGRLDKGMDEKRGGWGRMTSEQVSWSGGELGFRRSVKMTCSPFRSALLTPRSWSVRRRSARSGSGVVERRGSGQTLNFNNIAR
jgi:hypothetical protein